MFSIVGFCDVSGDCISSANYPNGYSGQDTCQITVQQVAYVHILDDFHIETSDRLNVAGSRVLTKQDMPRLVNSGDVIEWDADSDQENGGWKFCLQKCFEVPMLCFGLKRF